MFFWNADDHFLNAINWIRKMADEPCVKIPLSELRWMLLALEETYSTLVERVFQAKHEEVNFEEGMANLQETEIAYTLFLLEARVREHLIGGPPAPAFSLGEDMETFLKTRLNTDPETYQDVPRVPEDVSHRRPQGAGTIERLRRSPIGSASCR